MPGPLHVNHLRFKMIHNPFEVRHLESPTLDDREGRGVQAGRILGHWRGFYGQALVRTAEKLTGGGVSKVGQITSSEKIKHEWTGEWKKGVWREFDRTMASQRNINADLDLGGETDDKMLAQMVKNCPYISRVFHQRHYLGDRRGRNITTVARAVQKMAGEGDYFQGIGRINVVKEDGKAADMATQRRMNSSLMSGLLRKKITPGTGELTVVECEDGSFYIEPREVTEARKMREAHIEGELGREDEGKPSRRLQHMVRSGGHWLNVREAQFMLNVAGVGDKHTVVDPFAGSGRILALAGRRGALKVVGLNFHPDPPRDWPKDSHLKVAASVMDGINRGGVDVQLHNLPIEGVRDELGDEESVDAVVTEPPYGIECPLGPKTMSALAANSHRILKKGGSLVLMARGDLDSTHPASPESIQELMEAQGFQLMDSYEMHRSNIPHKILHFIKKVL